MTKLQSSTLRRPIIALAAAGALSGCFGLFKSNIAPADGSWHGAVSGAVTISNPSGPHPMGGERVAAKFVDWQINQNFADVALDRVSADGMCFKVSAWQTQAENTKAYDLMIAPRDEKRTVSEFPPTATNGQVEVQRRWTKPIYNEFHVLTDQLPYVDYSVCFNGQIALGPDTGTIILRGTNTWDHHAFAIFNVSRMGG